MKDILGKVLLLPMLLHEEGWEALPKMLLFGFKHVMHFLWKMKKQPEDFLKKYGRRW